MRTDKAAKYYELATNFANLFSKDPNTKVGAIFLAQESYEVLSMSYNGMPRGIDETVAARWERPVKYLWTAHAEENGIVNAARHGTPLNGCIAVVTHYPCANCARMLIQAGVKTIVTAAPNIECERWGAHYAVSIEMFAEAGTHVMLV